MRLLGKIRARLSVNPANPNAEADTQQVVSAASLLHHKVVTERAESGMEIDRVLWR